MELARSPWLVQPALNLLADEMMNIGQGVLGSVGDGQGGDQQEVGV